LREGRKIYFEVFAEAPVWEFLSAESIVKDYLQGEEKALSFFTPFSLEDLFEETGKIARPDMGGTAAALMSFNRSMGASDATLENVNRLENGALVVMTGQQPGVLTGPLYTVYKALTAVQVAADLSEEGGTPVVPAFWVAGEDHDFDEIAQVYVVDGDGRSSRMVLPGEMGRGGGPVGSISLNENVRLFLNRFIDALPAGGFSGEVESCLFDALKSSANLGEWFSRLMTSLMGEYGLVLVDPSLPALKDQAAPLFQKALDKPLLVTELLNDAGDRLESLDYRRQIHKTDDLCPFFLINSGKRDNVRVQGGIFTSGDLRFSEGELRAVAEREPERFSPNAAMRPIFSDYLLPTVVYVAGPGEIGYYAQLREIYEYFGVPMPQVRMRKSLTLVEPRVRRILKKLGLSPLELLDRGELLDRLIRRKHDITSPSFWDEKVDAVNRLIGEVRDDVATLDPTLSGALENTIGSVSERIRSFEAKLLRNLKGKETLLKAQIDLAGERLFPGGGLQERTLNVFYFLAVYGRELLRRVMDCMPPDGARHHFIHIS